MKILAVGDIVGKTGVQMLKYKLPKIMKDYDIDFVIVNGENAADGMGLTEKLYKEILSVGTDVVTMGNHTWAKKDIFSFIDDGKIIRPANYPTNNPGKGYQIFHCKNKKIAVINLIGRVTMSVLSENPFIVVEQIIEKNILHYRLYIIKGDLDEAECILLKTFNIAKSNSLDKKAAEISILIGRYYIGEKREAEAARYLAEGVGIFRSLGILNN